MTFIEILIPVLAITMAAMIIYCYKRANDNFEAYDLELKKSILLLDFISREESISNEGKEKLMDYMTFLDKEL